MIISKSAFIVVLFLSFALLFCSASFGQTEEEAKNMAVMKRLYDEVINQGKMESFDGFFTDDFIEHEKLPNMASGREGVKQLFSMMRKGFSDLKFVVNDIAASGDKVWSYITITGTQDGPFLDMPASGKKISVNGFDLVRFVNGKAAEHWGLTDDVAMMTQLGAMAPAEEKK